MTVKLQRGFTLIEALIALLVLSIGLLGVAGMQLKALQSAHAGYQRSIASLAAQDAQERLWAELKKNASGSYVCPSESVVNGSNWQAAWKAFLPGLSESPVGEPSLECVYNIKIKWGDARFAEGDPVFVYTARLLGTPASGT